MGKFALFVVIAATIAACYLLYKNTSTSEEYVTINSGAPGRRYYKMDDSNKNEAPLNFDLVDPECAPEAQLSKILYGSND